MQISHRRPRGLRRQLDLSDHGACPLVVCAEQWAARVAAEVAGLRQKQECPGDERTRPHAGLSHVIEVQLQSFERRVIAYRVRRAADRPRPDVGAVASPTTWAMTTSPTTVGGDDDPKTGIGRSSTSRSFKFTVPFRPNAASAWPVFASMDSNLPSSVLWNTRLLSPSVQYASPLLLSVIVRPPRSAGLGVKIQSVFPVAGSIAATWCTPVGV